MWIAEPRPHFPHPASGRLRFWNTIACEHVSRWGPVGVPNNSVEDPETCLQPGSQQHGLKCVPSPRRVTTCRSWHLGPHGQATSRRQEGTGRCDRDRLAALPTLHPVRDRRSRRRYSCVLHAACSLCIVIRAASALRHGICICFVRWAALWCPKTMPKPAVYGGRELYNH
jgi:hypothetical protein